MIHLRTASKDDAHQVFEWRNDPWIVSLGGNQRQVSWEEHSDWFKRTVANPDRLLLIIENDAGTGMGTTRLDRINETTAVITVYLLKSFIGEGRGTQAILDTSKMAFSHWPVLREIHAEIRRENERSIRAFGKCGYILNKNPGDQEEDMLLMIKRRSASDGPIRQSLEGFYLPRLDEHHADHQTVGWGSQKSQWRRFEVLAEVGDIHSASVLDVGCGVGHFLEYLEANGFAGKYRGIDILEEMVTRARQEHPAREFDVVNLLNQPETESADYVFASGIFTFADMELLKKMVTAMFGACRRAMAFNSLSAWAPDPDPGEFNADPLQVLEFCRSLSPRVTLNHAYLPHDFTLYLYKDQHAT